MVPSYRMGSRAHDGSSDPIQVRTTDLVRWWGASGLRFLLSARATAARWTQDELDHRISLRAHHHGATGGDIGCELGGKPIRDHTSVGTPDTLIGPCRYSIEG